MRRVVWSQAALDDLGNTLDFLAEHDLQSALRLVEQLRIAGEKLGTTPTGRPGRVLGTFEKSLPRLRYVIAYSLDRPTPNTLVVVRVIHTARNWPTGEWPGARSP